MKYEITLECLKNTSFKERNIQMHRLINSMIIQGINLDNSNNVGYSFYLERKKEYFKNKKYKLLFNTIDMNIINKLKSFDFSNKDFEFNFKILNFIEKEDEIKDYIQIYNLNYEIKEPVVKNWNIKKECKTKNLYYDLSMGIDLLKELIQYQVYAKSPLIDKIKSNKLTKHKKEYYEFIDEIYLDPNKKSIFMKNQHIMAYDLLIKVKGDKASKLLAREMTNKGMGCKNSYGFGFASYYDYDKGVIC